MPLFEIPRGVDPDVRKAFEQLLKCCETVQGWGTWHDIPFSAANFTVSATGGTWTVTAANVKTLKCLVVHGENINVVGEGGALGQITFEVRHA